MSDEGENDEKNLVHQGQETVLRTGLCPVWTGRTGSLEEDGHLFGSSLQAVPYPSTPENVTALMLVSSGSIQPEQRPKQLTGWRGGSETLGPNRYENDL